MISEDGRARLSEAMRRRHRDPRYQKLMADPEVRARRALR